MARDQNPAASSPTFSASEKAVWLFALRLPHGSGEGWAEVEDIFVRSAERLFRSQSASMSAEQVLAAVYERRRR